jgi:hypothetical protein
MNPIQLKTISHKDLWILNEIEDSWKLHDGPDFYVEVTTFDLNVCKIGLQLANLGSHVLCKCHLSNPTIKEGLSNPSPSTQETTLIISKPIEMPTIQKPKKMPQVCALCFDTKATICLKVNKHDSSWNAYSIFNHYNSIIL